MLHLDFDGHYADVLELALYNGALSGLSRDGEHYFYANTLDSDGRHTPLGLAPLPLLHDERLAAGRLGRRLFLLDRRRRDRHPPLRRHLASSTVDGSAVRIRRSADYPWSGEIRDRGRARGAGRVHAEAAHPRLGAGRDAAVNGERSTSAATQPGYLDLRRHWSPGDASSSTCRCRPSASTPIPTCAWISAASRSGAGRWSIASSRPTIRRSGAAPPPAARRRDRRQRRATISSTASSASPPRRQAADTGDWDGKLYRTEPPAEAPATLTAIPYYLWDNREPGRMMVWLAGA